MARVRSIRNRRHLAKGVAALAAADKQMRPVAKRAGRHLKFDAQEEGFAALAEIVVSQQLSAAAADTIFNRLKERIAPFEPAVLLAASEEVLRGAGLSAPKQKHLRSISARIVSGHLDLEKIKQLADDDACAHLIETPGIGPWTAEVYLMSSLGRADVWPAGDLALARAVAHALGLRRRPNIKAMIRIGERWRPWRTVAARLFWTHYRLEEGESKRRTAAKAKSKSEPQRKARRKRK